MGFISHRDNRPGIPVPFTPWKIVFQDGRFSIGQRAPPPPPHEGFEFASALEGGVVAERKGNVWRFLKDGKLLAELHLAGIFFTEKLVRKIFIDSENGTVPRWTMRRCNCVQAVINVEDSAITLGYHEKNGQTGQIVLAQY